MNNFMYTVLKAVIPVMFLGVSIHIHVKYVVRHSVRRVFLKDINTFIVVSALTAVKYVIRHSLNRAVL